MEIALIMLLMFGEEIVEDMYIEDVVLAFLSIYLSTIFFYFTVVINFFLHIN